MNSDENSKGLPGTYKAGAWYHNARFADPREDDTGLSLADPGSSGNAKMRRGNWGFYGVADQLIWHQGDDRDHGIGLFARAFVQPGDRNLSSFQGDLGLNVKGLLFGRKDDTLGLGWSYLKISDR